MASHTYPHRTFCYHGAEGDNDVHSNWQNWQDGHMYAMAHPTFATRAFEADTISPSMESLLEQQNTFSTPETILDDGSTAPIRNANGYLESFGSSESMLPPIGPFISPVNQLAEWNSLSSSMIFPSSLHIFPSACNTYGNSTGNHIAMGEYPYVGVSDNNSTCNIAPSASVNNDFLLLHAGGFPIFLPYQGTD